MRSCPPHPTRPWSPLRPNGPPLKPARERAWTAPHCATAPESTRPPPPHAPPLPRKALSGGNSRATALFLKLCPYRANSQPRLCLRVRGSLEATSILSQGDVRSAPQIGPDWRSRERIWESALEHLAPRQPLPSESLRERRGQTHEIGVLGAQPFTGEAERYEAIKEGLTNESV